MLLVNKDNSLEIHSGDSFSLLCEIDFEINEPSDLIFVLTDEKNEKIIEKKAEKHGDYLYFIFASDDTKLSSGLYNYYIKWTFDEQNGTTIINNVLKVKRSV